MEDIRARNIAALQEFVGFLKDYTALYWIFYQKRKHGNTVINMLAAKDFDGESTMVIPVVYDSKNPEKQAFVVANRSIHAHWMALLNNVVMLSKDLVDRALDFVELGGVGLAEMPTFCPLSPEEKARLNGLVAKCYRGLTRTKIQVNCTIEVPEKLMRKHMDLFGKATSRAGGAG